MLKSILALGITSALALSAGCTSQISLKDYASGSLSPAVLPTSPYTLQSMLPAPGQYKHLRVYIEGDGHAWATSDQPSTDPTPHNSLMLRYASQDAQPSAYLARPCQYVMSPNCDVQTWTGGRFSRQVMNAMNHALDTIKGRYGVVDFDLVGHSGGGEVALVLAGMRDDVTFVQTIAGNIEPELWTRIHQLTPLDSPVTPLNYSERLKKIPQRHIVGLNDGIVPPIIAQGFISRLNGACVEIATTDASHDTGYDDAWSRYSITAPPCKGQ